MDKIPLVQINQTLPLLGDSPQRVSRKAKNKMSNVRAARDTAGKKYISYKGMIDLAVDAFDYDNLD